MSSTPPDDRSDAQPPSLFHQHCESRRLARRGPPSSPSSSSDEVDRHVRFTSSLNDPAEASVSDPPTPVLPENFSMVLPPALPPLSLGAAHNYPPPPLLLVRAHNYPPPPPLLGLQRANSVSYASQPNETAQSKFELARSAVETHLHNTRGSRTVIFQFDTATRILEGTTEELCAELDATMPSGGTHFSSVFSAMKKKYLELSEADRAKCCFLLFTDGEDTSGNPFDPIMIEGLTFHQILGIGSIDHQFLTSLARGQPDICHFVDTEEAVFAELNGGLHELAHTQMQNATISLWCPNNGNVKTLEGVTRSYHSDEEKAAIIAMMGDVAPSAAIHFQEHNNTIIVHPTFPPRAAANQDIIYFIAMDTSGSMADRASNAPVARISAPEIDEAKPWVKLTIQVANVTSDTNLLLGGNVTEAYVKYTDPSTQTIHCEAIGVQNLFNSDVMATSRHIMLLSEAMSKDMKKTEVQELYRGHLDLKAQLESAPQWLSAMGNMIHANLRNRYRSTLTRGQQFFEGSAATPSLQLLLRASSSCSASQSVACQSVAQPIDDMEALSLCKLCFENKIDTLFSECHHAGVCRKCFTENIDITHTQKCPFCREPVANPVKVNITGSGIMCTTSDCNATAKYIGLQCGHVLHCKKCKDKNKVTDEMEFSRVPCTQCKADGSVSVNYIKANFP